MLAQQHNIGVQLQESHTIKSQKCDKNFVVKHKSNYKRDKGKRRYSTRAHIRKQSINIHTAVSPVIYLENQTMLSQAIPIHSRMCAVAILLQTKQHVYTTVFTLYTHVWIHRDVPGEIGPI